MVSKNFKYHSIYEYYLSHCIENFQTAKDILENGFHPRGDKAITININEIDWDYSDNNKDKNSQYQIHAWRMLDCFFSEYSSGDLEAAIFWQITLKVIGPWYKTNIVENKSCSHQWFDMAVGIRCSKIAFLLSIVADDIAEKHVTHRESAILDKLARSHIDRFIIDKNLLGRNNSNHDYFVLLGKRQLFQSYGDYLKSQTAAIDYSIRGLFHQWFNNGCHVENSPSYHFFMLSKLKNYLSNYQEDTLSKLLLKADKIKDFLCFPERLIQFGDTDGGTIGNTIKFIEDIDVDHYSSIVKHKNDYVVLDPFDCGDGYFVVRSKEFNRKNRFSMLAINGKNVCKAHKHDDFLSFELMECGRIIYSDSGKFSYSLDPFSISFRMPSAHNSIMLDGEDINSLYSVKGHPLIKTWNYSLNDVFYISGGYRKANYSVTRDFLYKPGYSLIVKDQIQISKFYKNKKLYHFLQIGHGMNVKKLGEFGFELYENEGSLGRIQISFCSNVNLIEASTSIVSGEHEWKNLGHLGWYSSSYNKSTPRITIVTEVLFNKYPCKFEIIHETNFLSGGHL